MVEFRVVHEPVRCEVGRSCMSLLDEKMTSELADSLKRASDAARASLEETVTRQTTRLRSSTKTRKSAATRERIMAAATSLMVERGNTDFQMSEVSARCRMSKGALYYYFADKDALVEAIFDRSIDELVDSVEAVVAGASSALESLVSLTRELTCHMSAGSPLALAMAREVIDANNNVLPSMETHFARIISIVSAQLERAKGEGMVREGVNSRLGAVAISGAFIFAALEVASLGDDAPTGDRLAHSLIDIVLNGMGTETAHTALVSVESAVDAGGAATRPPITAQPSVSG